MHVEDYNSINFLLKNKFNYNKNMNIDSNINPDIKLFG